jgi:helicase MOV-10
MKLCPNFTLQGVCDDGNCVYFHPNLICDLCGVTCSSQKTFNAHLRGNRHAKMKKAAERRSKGGPKKCTICDVRLVMPGDVPSHVSGQRHQGRLLEYSLRGVRLDTNAIIVDDEENCFECFVCENIIWYQTKAFHERSLRHQRKERYLRIRASLEEAEADKNGVSVSPSGKDAFDFGLVPSGKATRDFSISIEGSQAQIILRSATLSNATIQQSLYVCYNVRYNY